MCKDFPLSHSLDEDTKEIYNEFNPRGLFEIVFVALGDNKKLFDEACSAIPWFAIPHENKKEDI